MRADAGGNARAHRIDVHAGERVDDGRAAQQQHGRDQDVGQDAEEEEGQVRRLAPARHCAAMRHSTKSVTILALKERTARTPTRGLSSCNIAQIHIKSL